jgi:hypothetical protein
MEEPASVDTESGSLGWSKLILYSLTPLVVLLLCSEVFLRGVYFQIYSDHTFAISGAIERAQRYVGQQKTERNLQRVRSYLPVYQAASEALYMEEGRALRQELEAEYTRHFVDFVRTVEEAGSKLVVLSYFQDEAPFGQFISTLIDRSGVDHVSVAEPLAAYPEERVRLLPHDLHLSRFGNFIVAEVLGAHLKQYSAHRNPRTYQGTPVLLGDMPPKIDNIYNRDSPVPYHVRSNTQGLRMTEDVDVSKQRQRILCIGDSNTFGYGVHTQDTYPALLARQFPQWEVLNAGISGYTISDELGLFRERARYAAPDITVLQVTHNDIIELTAYRKNLTGRATEDHHPSTEEQRFFDLMERRLALERDTMGPEPGTH